MTTMSDHNERFMETFAPEKTTPIEELEMKRQQVIMEYNQKILSELLLENSLRPVRLNHVTIQGSGSQFRDTFLARQLRPLLKHPHAFTLQSFLQNVDATAYNFTKTGSMNEVSSMIDPHSYRSPLLGRDTLELTTLITVKPVKKLFMNVGTNVGNGEGDGYLTLQWRNIFGGAESLTFDTNMASNQIGSKNRSQYLLNYSMPVFNSPDYKFSTMCYHSSRFIDYTTYHEQGVSGITTKLSTNYLPFEKRINQELSLETLIRSIKLEQSPNGYRNNSLINDYFLFNAGTSPKTSLVYAISHDTRNQPIFPTSGHFVKSTTEYSFLPASNFVKTTLQLSQALKLNESAGVSVVARTGLIKALGSSLVHPMDKFQSGGPNDIRGFWNSGIGPKQMGLSIGGDAFCGLGFSLFNRVPFLSSESNFKIHSFVNAGKLINLDTTKADWGYSNVFKQMNVSTGIGLMYAHPAARFELNFTLPVAIHHGDEVRKGIQWGIGLSFL
ncbi:hypothetical protein OGAPHI_004235 [Ogataea philodendri]|uniref:Bacterial surface antigen (D15) domain-containing protein n=1 Tax=Ogataea philodendri TaxID=1378263 RepID=A0A9P8T4S6_9ASCO|nr:uncharacterized protein OGAPHI_004235 [Ogataea philodendri]KAH3666046.1 hypothetical protein OGAPHI_004235 [Ogataea philodendri]